MTPEQISRIQTKLGLPKSWADRMIAKRGFSLVEIKAPGFFCRLLGSIEIAACDDDGIESIAISASGSQVAMHVTPQQLTVETTV